MNAIDATSPHDVWAAGDGIYHWNGARWRTVPAPNPGGEASWEYSVLIEVHDERDEMVARRVVGVGALRSGEGRKFTLRVEVLVPESSGLTAAS